MLRYFIYKWLANGLCLCGLGILNESTGKFRAGDECGGKIEGYMVFENQNTIATVTGSSNSPFGNSFNGDFNDAEVSSPFTLELHKTYRYDDENINVVYHGILEGGNERKEIVVILLNHLGPH